MKAPQAPKTEVETGEEVIRGRTFPALSGRLHQLQPGIFYALLSVKVLLKMGDRTINMGSITSIARGFSPRPDISGVQEAVGVLVGDEVLVDKERDGRLKIALDKLEERLEIYTECA